MVTGGPRCLRCNYVQRSTNTNTPLPCQVLSLAGDNDERDKPSPYCHGTLPSVWEGEQTTKKKKKKSR